MRLVCGPSSLLFRLLCVGQMQMGDMAKVFDSRPGGAGGGVGELPPRDTDEHSGGAAVLRPGDGLHHAFNHDEARRSFERAAQLDPKAAMPWWGVALAVGPNYNDIDIGHARAKQAVEALGRAKQLAAGGPAVEKDYVDALAARYSAELQTMGKEYAAAGKGLMLKYPDDLDAATLYAESLMDLRPWQLWSADGRPNEGTEEIVATLKSVVARDPEHVGANHFLIHAVEASNDPSDGLPSAKRLETLAPAAGHLVHMPAHIYQRVGDFNGSAVANERAMAADEAYVKSQHLEGVANMYNMMYLTHNIHFLAAACMMEGRSACAVETADRLVKHVSPHVGEHAGGGVVSADAAVGAGAVSEVGGDLESSGCSEGDAGAGGDVALRARVGVCRAGKSEGGFGGARGSGLGFSEPAREAFDGLPQSREAGYGDGAHGAGCADRRGQGRPGWSDCVMEEGGGGLGYAGLQRTFGLVLSGARSLGGALLRDGKPVEAEAVFRRDLELNPRSGRSLFGLWQSLVAQKRDADAVWVKKQFDDAWGRADVKLTVGSL